MISLSEFFKFSVAFEIPRPLRLYRASSTTCVVRFMKLSLAMTFTGFALADTWNPLFVGNSLKGWTNVNCAPETFRVTNGILYSTGIPTGELRTTRMYQNYILEVEWRHMKPKGNAGLFMWADPLTARGQPFIRGIEVQVLDGQEGPTYTSDGDLFPIHGAKMVPENGRGGDRAFPIEKRIKPSPEWNHYRVECVDGSIRLSVNGKVVTRGNQCSPRKGYICVESEGSPCEFRNMRIQELPMSPLPHEAIAEPDPGMTCLYSGLDFRGWNLSAEGANFWASTDWILNYKGDASGRTHELSSQIEFGDFDLIFDWKRSVERTKTEVFPALDCRGELEYLRSEPGILKRWELAEKPLDEWNRVRIVRRGTLFQCKLNDILIVDTNTSPGLPARAPIRLRGASSPFQWANLYIHPLD